MHEAYKGVRAYFAFLQTVCAAVGRTHTHIHWLSSERKLIPKQAKPKERVENLFQQHTNCWFVVRRDQAFIVSLLVSVVVFFLLFSFYCHYSTIKCITFLGFVRCVCLRLSPSLVFAAIRRTKNLLPMHFLCLVWYQPPSVPLLRCTHYSGKNVCLWWIE